MWIAATALLLASVCGAAGGYLLGRMHTQEMAEARLAQSAIQPVEKFQAMLDEEHTDLAALQQTRFPPCSDAEVAFFRQTIFHGVMVKDIGRMRNGKIECSAMLGRENLPLTQFKPAFGYVDGTKVYFNLPPAESSTVHVYSRLLGNFYVMEDPNFSEYMRWLKQNSEVNTFDAVSLNKRPPARQAPAAVTDRNSQGKVLDTLYATRCSSSRSSTCVTARQSLSAALTADRTQLILGSAVGGIIGSFLVMIYILIYQRSRNMSQQLRRAIRNDRLRVVYQPIVDLANGQIVEAEALVRWTDEDGFAVSPEVFVHIAEEHGFGCDLTSLVTRHALRDFHELLQSNPDFRLNINVTATDLASPTFLAGLERFLAEAGVAARSLAIEVTESSIVNTKKVRDTIHTLGLRGHSVQIDDFGTGYSSLAYLKDLSIDTIKIDKAFTQAIGTEAVTLGILPQILVMAHTLNLQVIVEGIETAEQSGFFAGSERRILGQGWFYGHPVSAQEFHRIAQSQIISTR
jgi:sensor c-di-GMP phosphodiesterase-like protein